VNDAPLERSSRRAAFVAIATFALAGVATAQSTAVQRDSIPGTLVIFEMVRVPGGAVTVDGAEGPRRIEVAPFWIGRTELTWDAYDTFTLSRDPAPSPSGAADAAARPSRPYGAPDYGFGHAGYPAISIARAAAEAFCAWLSARTGKKYRLPTEAEWVRAATLAAPTWSPERRETIAWHRANAGAKTHAVGSKQADALGLYDLFGNAAEWVVRADGSLVVRGGSYQDPPEHVGPTASSRQTDAWNERDPQIPKSRWWLSDGPFVGFRIVREP
jgi:formylglycine-generating enzyme required for sulfatase activity